MKAPALLAIILILSISSSMTNADQLYSGTVRAILRIPGSSVLKNLFQRRICDSNITLVQKMKKNQTCKGLGGDVLVEATV
jgi:hypothetical protein